MRMAAGRRRAAVLETSFWVAACRAEVGPNCLDLYEIVVPRAVEAELRSVPLATPQREYPYATLFRHLRAKMLHPPPHAPPPLPIFGSGEAEALALAEHLRAILLINERRGARYAASLGVQVITVPAVIVALRERDVISDRAAGRKLALIEPITSRDIVADARRALEAL
jgi:hypothetical protein